VPIAMPGLDRPTRVARLAAGPVEYRLERRGDDTVLVFHGGHQRAGLPLGEEVFAEAGYTVLAPSRPGYGRTPLSTGRSVTGFADIARALCEHLGITRVAAVVGTSAGGPTAVAMAARHPDLVQRLILQSAVGPLPYPDRRTRLAAYVGFSGRVERVTWRVIGAMMRVAPEASLRLWLGQLSMLPVRQVVAALSAQDRAAVRGLVLSMRSGYGFHNDLRAAPDLTADVVQPTLVIATRHDGGVPFAHADALVAAIPRAELVESHADSHLIWLGPDWPAIAARVRAFLSVDPIPAQPLDR